ncbi:MAG: entry exclusion 1 domain-containing protein [Alphaproteobacteria bacterium]
MAKVGAQRAAELTGKSKSTIQRCMSNGKLSYDVDSAGRRMIDVSELERVFGLEKQATVAVSANVEHELDKAKQMLEMERMRLQMKALQDQLDIAHEQISDLKTQRDKWQKQADQVLITSQYSQKQAEELRNEIKERERKAMERRQQMLDERVKKLNAENENSAAAENANQTKPVDAVFQGIWKKVRGQ